MFGATCLAHFDISQKSHQLILKQVLLQIYIIIIDMRICTYKHNVNMQRLKHLDYLPCYSVVIIIAVYRLLAMVRNFKWDILIKTRSNQE